MLSNDTELESTSELFTIDVLVDAGDVHQIDAAAGYSAMELIRAAGLPIIAECGGVGVCATCHCRVPEAWAAKLPQPTRDELEKLDEIPLADDRSRLSCQIQISERHVGLRLELQADSIKQERGRLPAAGLPHTCDVAE